MGWGKGQTYPKKLDTPKKPPVSLFIFLFYFNISLGLKKIVGANFFVIHSLFICKVKKNLAPPSQCYVPAFLRDRDKRFISN